MVDKETDMVLRRSARSGEHLDFLSHERSKTASKSLCPDVSWRLFATLCYTFRCAIHDAVMLL